MFTFIRQQLDYLSTLNWPNKEEEASIRVILLESIAKTVDDYSYEMISLSRTELTDMKTGINKMIKIPLSKKKLK
jgi:hypothetical protein